MAMEFKNIASSFKIVQEKTIKQLEQYESSECFSLTKWKHNTSGGGLTRVLSNGKNIEKAAVNFSDVGGEVTNAMRSTLKVEALQYKVCGVSSIIHPVNPMVPIIHMNIRYFEFDNGEYWFGGGIDLTPHYIDPMEAKDFHNKLNALCEQYDPSFYRKFSEWATDYFYLPHRKESRGIGGIFFDRLNEKNSISKEKLFDFVLATGNTYGDIYSEILLSKAKLPYSSNEKKWQELRRSRYVEFNLLYDKGTQFGLQSNGRTESIFVSMPPTAKWDYDYTPKAFSKEDKTLSLLGQKNNWLNYEE